MNTFDLQIQTTASDGKHSPAECVGMAKENGLETIAITDHDTVAGVEEAVVAGKKIGIRVIPGIEMTVEDHGMHLLGYGLDINNSRLGWVLEKFAAGRIVGAQEMVSNLQRSGFRVEWLDVLAEATGGIIARPHIASAVMKRKENAVKLSGITTTGDFIKKFLANDNPNYVHRKTISAKDALELLHEAGGVAVWSHPPIPDFVENCPALEEFLKNLVGWGLDGLELFNPANTEKDVVCLEKLAGRYGLLKTAGSDFHQRYDPGDEPWPRPASKVGEFPTFGRSTAGMLEALYSAMALPRP